MRAEDTKRIEELLKKGATLGEDKNLLGELISDLITKKNLSMIRLYIALGGPVERVFGNGNTPMRAAARYGNAEIIQLLLDAGASTYEKNGSTVLYNAVQAGNLSTVQKLIEAGALTGSDPKKIMDLAIKSHHQNVLDLLRQKGLTLTDEQQALLAKCPFKEIQCDNGVMLHSGPPECNPVKCIQYPESEPRQELIAHPSNAVNAEAMDVLSHGSSEQKTAIIKKIMENPGIYTPLILEKMADVLFHKFRDDEGIFWAMAAELRTLASDKICRQNGQGKNIFIIPTYDFYKRREPERV